MFDFGNVEIEVPIRHRSRKTWEAEEHADLNFRKEG